MASRTPSNAQRDLDRVCRDVVRLLLAEAHTHGRVTLEQDFGPTAVTLVTLDDHYHIGMPDGSWEHTVRHLHSVLQRRADPQENP